ncbi:hypothetical protein BH23THE1_BH23THE1_10750 [soil metagenome]
MQVNLISSTILTVLTRLSINMKKSISRLKLFIFIYKSTQYLNVVWF